MTVKEVSKLSGVTIRALQYYDKIGLLAPAEVKETDTVCITGKVLKRCSRFYFQRTWVWG